MKPNGGQIMTHKYKVRETLNSENFWPHFVKGRKDESVPKLRSPKDDASSKLEKSDVQTIRA